MARPTRSKRLRRAWLGIGCLLVLLVAALSLSPGGDMPPPFPQADKLVHLAMYLSLGGWFACVAHRALLLLAALAFYGVVLEIGQEFVPGRGLDILDMLANLLGAILGLLAVRFIWNPFEWLQHKQT